MTPTEKGDQDLFDHLVLTHDDFLDLRNDLRLFPPHLLHLGEVCIR